MKKYVKIALVVVVAAIFVGTFAFLYSKSKPQIKQYEIATPEITDLEKTTVATERLNHVMKSLLNHRFRVLLMKCTKKPDKQ